MTRTDKIMSLIAEYGDSCRNSFLASSEEFEDIRKIVQAMVDELERMSNADLERAKKAISDQYKHLEVNS
jgi:hypothetical protein